MDENIDTSNQPRRSNLKTALFVVYPLSLSLLAFIFFTQNPGKGGPTLILGVLLLLFCLTVCTAVAILNFCNQLLRQHHFSKVRLLYTSVAIASGVVFLVGLQTLSQLQLIDIILVVVFELLLNFYLLRRF